MPAVTAPTVEQVPLSELRTLAEAEGPDSAMARALAAVLGAAESQRWQRPRVYRFGNRLHVVDGAPDPDEATLVMRRVPPPPAAPQMPPWRRRR